MPQNKQHRPIYQIAREIHEDWQKPYYGAVPYLEAMNEISSINDKYYFDDGKSVVLYFLSNATTWRGDKARAIKAELKDICRASENG